MEQRDVDKIISDLDAMKRLMVLQLLDKGFTQSQIALTLGIAQQTVSKMFPKGVLGKSKSKAQ